MFKKSLHDRTDRFHHLAWLLPAFLLLTPWSARAGVRELCTYADRLELDTTSRVDEGGRGCYRIDVAASGVLAVEASAPGSPEAEPRLVLLGGDGSGTVRHRILQQTPRAVVVEVEAPGTFFVLVGPEDPAMPLAGYKLRTGFAARLLTKDVDENDEDGSEIKTRRKPDLGAFALCAGLSEKLETYGVAEFDDHGDTPLCATPLELGGSVSGAIDNASGDDEDVFTFVVDGLLSVAIAATAGHLTLYDGRGQRLASSIGDRTPVLVRVLSPGRYYLRMQDLRGFGEMYDLSLEARIEP